MSGKKEWLIRTRNNQIWGPVSRGKIVELLQNGSLHHFDEICKGNGHWIFAKEENLIEKYIYNNNEMPFNPITESHDVLTANRQPSRELRKDREGRKVTLEDGSEVMVPSEEDLAYPHRGLNASPKQQEGEEGSRSGPDNAEEGEEVFRQSEEEAEVRKSVKLPTDDQLKRAEGIISKNEKIFTGELEKKVKGIKSSE